MSRKFKKIAARSFGYMSLGKTFGAPGKVQTQARAAEAESERFPPYESENAAADSLLIQFQALGRTSTEFAISVDEQRAHAPSDWLVAASIRRSHAKYTPSPSDTAAESDELASANAAAADDGTKDVVAANAHRPRADQHVTHA